MVRIAAGAIAALLLLVSAASVLAIPSTGPASRDLVSDPLLAQQRGSPPPAPRYSPPPQQPQYRAPPQQQPQNRPPQQSPNYRAPPSAPTQPSTATRPQRPVTPPPQPSLSPQQRQNFGRPSQTTPSIVRPSTPPSGNQRANTAIANNQQRPSVRNMPQRITPVAQQAAAVRTYRQASAFVPPPRPLRPTALSTRAVPTQQIAPRVAGVARTNTAANVVQPGPLKSQPSSSGSACRVGWLDLMENNSGPQRHWTAFAGSSFQVASLGSVPMASHGSVSLVDYPTFDGWPKPSFSSARDDAVLVADAGCVSSSLQSGAKSSDIAARAARIDKAAQGHANSMHGAGTTRDQQRLRAREGVPPDATRPKVQSIASRFTDEKYQDAAYRMARRKLSAYPNKAGEIPIRINMGRSIGEGYLKGGNAGDYRTTNWVTAVFRNGKLHTMYPDIARYPNEPMKR